MLRFNGFLRKNAASPKVPSTFFVRKEPDALINFLVPRQGFFDNFGVLCKIFLDVRYRKGKTCHCSDGRANFFPSILR